MKLTILGGMRILSQIISWLSKANLNWLIRALQHLSKKPKRSPRRSLLEVQRHMVSNYEYDAKVMHCLLMLYFRCTRTPTTKTWNRRRSGLASDRYLVSRMRLFDCCHLDCSRPGRNTGISQITPRINSQDYRGTGPASHQTAPYSRRLLS